MTSETAYQNQDLENQNPLKPADDAQKNPNSAKILGIVLPADPKIRLLIILGSIILLLLVISLIVSSSRKIPRPPARTAPTPTLAITPFPTEDPEVGKIPDDLKAKFSDVDHDINTQIDFNPPQIDPDIGLN